MDFRDINAATPLDAYPMPQTDKLLDKLGGAEYITILCIWQGDTGRYNWLNATG